MTCKSYPDPLTPELQQLYLYKFKQYLSSVSREIRNRDIRKRQKEREKE